MKKLLGVLLLFATSSAYSNDCNYLTSPPDAQRVAGTADVAEAWYAGPTTRYAHAVLGDSIEADTLYVLPKGTDSCALSVTLAAHSVFEDVTPRIADVTGDGQENIITIESHQDYGASLAIYGVQNGELTKITATPYIGTRFRWLAPIGTADFNGDDINDVAYVDRPHLAGIIRVWSFANSQPELLANAPGFSNHRIGENFITGGIALCDEIPTIIVPDRSWSQMIEVRMINGEFVSVAAADNTDESTIADLLACH